MLHGYLHAASVHDPRGPQICHRGSGEISLVRVYVNEDLSVQSFQVDKSALQVLIYTSNLY